VRVAVPCPGRPALELQGRRLRLDLLLETRQPRLAEFAEPVEVMKHVTQLRHPRVVRTGLAEALEGSIEREADRMEFRVSRHGATLAGDPAEAIMFRLCSVSAKTAKGDRGQRLKFELNLNTSGDDAPEAARP
jgi:hypothetical protein